MIAVPPHKVRRPAAALVGAALIAGALWGCGAKSTPPAPAPTVTVATPLPMNVIDWDDYVGQFTAIDSVDVRPRVTGYLLAVGFKDGDLVTKGQTLFTIDPRPYQAAAAQTAGQVARAAATLVNARGELARGRTLLAARAISQQSFDLLVAGERQTAADAQSARGAARAANLNLGFTKVIAPISGRISDRRVAPGNLVTADVTVLTNIVSLDPIRFAFTGSEALYLKYQRENQAGTRLSSRVMANPVEIRLQDEPTWRWKGHMDFVDNALDTGSGTIRGRAVIANPDHFLTPGMFGHLRLLGSGSYSALLIPDAAVVTDQERQIVYVVGADGLTRMQPVELGPLANGLRVVRKGLKSGDWVIIEGVQRAQAGRAVKIVRGRIAATPDGPSQPAVGPVASTATAAGPAR